MVHLPDSSLGRSKEEMCQVLEWTIPLLPQDKPRHLLGIGEIKDIFEVVKRGIDLFDCVAPTRMARTGTLFAKEAERFRIHNSLMRNLRMILARLMKGAIAIPVATIQGLI